MQSVRLVKSAGGSGGRGQWVGPQVVRRAWEARRRGLSSAQAGPWDCSWPSVGGEGQEVFEALDAWGDSCPAHLGPLTSDPHTGPPSNPSRGHPSVPKPRDLERWRV